MTVNIPAFPLYGLSQRQGQPIEQVFEHGMSLRDYFAAHAPEPPPSWRGVACRIEDLVAWRWWYADAMVKERGE